MHIDWTVSNQVNKHYAVKFNMKLIKYEVPIK